ncbi:hypothetical protein M0811_03221 [Anaeramoeba ignava]|uniref:Uncharacterized protein n=1 Tax=Anaeramoeba ignava TaxID=1746090 RepID=A0A9Q0L5U7_ANAIG|nr:hypothetical protein M0811_03221 [Anaeramoeba ignava]
MDSVKTFFSHKPDTYIQIVKKQKPLTLVYLALFILNFLSVLVGTWFDPAWLIISTSLVTFYFESLNGEFKKEMEEKKKELIWLKYVAMGTCVLAFIIAPKGKLFHSLGVLVAGPTFMYHLGWELYSVLKSEVDQLIEKKKK